MNIERSLRFAEKALRSYSTRQCWSLRTEWNAGPRDVGVRPAGHIIVARRTPRSTCSGTTRSFTTSPCLYKKGGKAAREERRATGTEALTEDPSDFTTLESDIAAAIEQLRDDLSKLRAGGRFNTEVLEDLRVQPDKNSKQWVRLSDLAQVIPKGRTVQILVGDKDHVKPTTSAIQSSNLNLTPQPDPTGQNPLLLIINIPPPTAESRRATVNEATKAGEKAGTGIKDGRAKQQKKLRGMQVSKSARPDDLKKAGDRMEKIVEKGQAEVKKIVENARKVLESG